ncbi:MAG: hypothetical protein AAF065_01400 [Verrucomicrobiota bacterium]
MRESIPEKEVYFPRSYSEIIRSKKDYRYIRGHWPSGITRFMRHNNYVRNGVVNIVAFREPIAQAKSLYRYYTLERSGAKGYRKNLERGVLDFYKNKPHLCNLQAKYLLGFLWVHHRSPLGCMQSRIARQLARLASRRLRSGYDYVLIQEDTMSGFEFIGGQLGLVCSFQRPDLTATADAHAVITLSEGEEEELKSMFNLDCILYRWVCAQYRCHGFIPQKWEAFSEF